MIDYGYLIGFDDGNDWYRLDLERNPETDYFYQSELEPVIPTQSESL